MAEETTQRYRIIATGLIVFGLAIFAGCTVAFAIWFRSGNVSPEPSDWGAFGDYISGLAGTLIALATLVAIAFTLHLQAKELSETRKQLQEQAKATRDAVDASNRQLTLGREIERRRIRPLLKAEWFPDDQFAFELRLTNVGLGAAIVDRIELYSHRQLFGAMTADDEAARILWKDALYHALGSVGLSTPHEIPIQSLTDLTRALAPGERQWMARVEFGDSDSAHEAWGALVNPAIFEPVVYFRSLSGQRLHTRNQFELDEL